MSGYNVTDRVRKVVQLAREEAFEHNRGLVSPGDILAGIIRDGEGVSAPLLTNLHVTLDSFLQDLRLVLGRGTEQVPSNDLPYATSAKKCLELAMAEARELDHKYVGTGHLLLGVLRHGDPLVGELLAKHGVTLESARAEMLRLTRPEDQRTPLKEGHPRFPSVLELQRALVPHDRGATEIAVVADLDAIPADLVVDLLGALDALHRSWGGCGLLIRSEQLGSAVNSAAVV